MKQRTNGKSLTIHRGQWSVTYYQDGKRKQKTTGTADYKEAEKFRDIFLKDAKPRERADRYIYKQGSKWLVQVRGHKVGRFKTIDKAREVRSVYMNAHKMLD